MPDRRTRDRLICTIECDRSRARKLRMVRKASAQGDSIRIPRPQFSGLNVQIAGEIESGAEDVDAASGVRISPGQSRNFRSGEGAIVEADIVHTYVIECTGCPI